jgi:hypothetical protein
MSAPKMSYFDMCKAAIVALKDRTGSSPQAIKAFITATYPDVTFGQVNSPSVLNFLPCIGFIYSIQK